MSSAVAGTASVAAAASAAAASAAAASGTAAVVSSADSAAAAAAASPAVASTAASSATAVPGANGASAADSDDDDVDLSILEVCVCLLEHLPLPKRVPFEPAGRKRLKPPFSRTIAWVPFESKVHGGTQQHQRGTSSRVGVAGPPLSCPLHELPPPIVQQRADHGRCYRVHLQAVLRPFLR